MTTKVSSQVKVMVAVSEDASIDAIGLA